MADSEFELRHEGIVVDADGLTARFVNAEILIKQAPPRSDCGMFWGSHGCDLPADGHTTHLCGGVDDPCCEFDEAEGRVRYWTFEAYDDGSKVPIGWSEWYGDWTGFRMESW